MRQALPPTRISTTSGRAAVEPGDLEVVDLAAVLPVAVDELVVEDAERDVDLGGLAHP